MMTRRRAVLAALLVCASGAALAHRFNLGLTELSFNAASGNVEVVHTYMSHDLDAMLAALHKRQVDLAQPADEALLRDYIQARFQLLGADRKVLPLKWIGVSLSTESVVIYQELEASTLAAVAQVRNQVLVEFLPRQINTVNIRQDGQIRTLSFDRKNAERRLR
ncbi:MAG: DUF6702 family protein [Pseudomonadota bacterium]